MTGRSLAIASETIKKQNSFPISKRVVTLNRFKLWQNKRSRLFFHQFIPLDKHYFKIVRIIDSSSNKMCLPISTQHMRSLHFPLIYNPFSEKAHLSKTVLNLLTSQFVENS